MDGNPYTEKANRARKGTDRIVSVQESHKGGTVGKSGENAGSSYKPKVKE